MVNSRGRFVWYELMTTDTEAAKVFYANVVGWETKGASTPDMPYTLFIARGVSIGGLMDLSEDAKKMGAKPGWIGYVGADDVDATADRIERLGGSVHLPPRDIPSVSRFSVVADPQTAPLGLLKWLIPYKDPAVELAALGHVGWYELLAADWETALSFYGELFGWERAEAVDIGAMGTYQLFSLGGTTIGGMFTKPATVPSPFWLYYFNIEDIDAAAKRVKAGGGQILNGPMEGPGSSWLLHCTDPQGVIFALVGNRSQDASGRALTQEASWSSEWGRLSSKGRVRISKVASRAGRDPHD
jgi:predicted enzyme related to lactoylglutathione lyase